MPEIKQLFSSPRCQHVHYSGRACKAPARRGRNYCVFHQAAHLDPGGCVLPIIEDLHSYQLAIIRIARALADDAIDARKATALLYALQLAGAKLTDFVKLREQVENPARALYCEVSERYQSLKHPFPPLISDRDLSAILKDIAREHQAQNIEPRANVAVSEDPLTRSSADPIVQSPDQQVSDSPSGVIPPQTDIGDGTHAAGAA